MNSIFQKFLYNVRHSMSTHLSVSILLMAVPVFILALGIFFIQSRYFIRKEAAQHVNSVLNTTIHHVCNYMSAVRTATNALTDTSTAVPSPSNRVCSLHTTISSQPTRHIPETRQR